MVDVEEHHEAARLIAAGQISDSRVGKRLGAVACEECTVWFGETIDDVGGVNSGAVHNSGRAANGGANIQGQRRAEALIPVANPALRERVESVKRRHTACDQLWPRKEIGGLCCRAGKVLTGKGV